MPPSSTKAKCSSSTATAFPRAFEGLWHATAPAELVAFLQRPALALESDVLDPAVSNLKRQMSGAW